jgi:hypothetical protein
MCAIALARLFPVALFKIAQAFAVIWKLRGVSRIADEQGGLSS